MQKLIVFLKYLRFFTKNFFKIMLAVAIISINYVFWLAVFLILLYRGAIGEYKAINRDFFEENQAKYVELAKKLDTKYPKTRCFLKKYNYRCVGSAKERPLEDKELLKTLDDLKIERIYRFFYEKKNANSSDDGQFFLSFDFKYNLSNTFNAFEESIYIPDGYNMEDYDFSGLCFVNKINKNWLSRDSRHCKKPIISLNFDFFYLLVLFWVGLTSLPVVGFLLHGFLISFPGNKLQ